MEEVFVSSSEPYNSDLQSVWDILNGMSEQHHCASVDHLCPSARAMNHCEASAEMIRIVHFWCPVPRKVTFGSEGPSRLSAHLE